jgi:hypothetical protein
MASSANLAALAMALALAAAPVRADVIKVFEANGVFTDGVDLGGTLTIDVTTGDVTAANLLLSEPISAEVTLLAGTGEAGGGFARHFRGRQPGFPLSSSASSRPRWSATAVDRWRVTRRRKEEG